jgi:hypothetical protein
MPRTAQVASKQLALRAHPFAVRAQLDKLARGIEVPHLEGEAEVGEGVLRDEHVVQVAQRHQRRQLERSPRQGSVLWRNGTAHSGKPFDMEAMMLPLMVMTQVMTMKKMMAMVIATPAMTTTKAMIVLTLTMSWHE